MLKTTTEGLVNLKKPQLKYKILDVLEKRFSPRFISEDIVGENDLNSIIEAARWTPSARNRQPWFFYIAKKGSISHEKLARSLIDINPWAVKAPVLILACHIIKDEVGDNPYSLYDLGASVFALSVQAQSLGYYVRQIAGFDKAKVRNSIKLEEFHEPFVIVALGRIGNYENAPEWIIEKDYQPRIRKEKIFINMD